MIEPDLITVELAPPPPSPVLLGAIEAMQPVPTRRPARRLALALGAGLAWAALLAMAGSLRADAPAPLPVELFAPLGLWLGGYVLAFRGAIVPRAGQVVPEAEGAGRVAALVSLGALLLGLVWPGPPGLVAPGAPALLGIAHCAGFSLAVAAGVIATGVALLKADVITGPWRIGAALGAAGGAAGGIALHLVCADGGRLHLTLGHGGAVVLGALIGAVFLPAVLRPAARTRH